MGKKSKLKKFRKIAKTLPEVMVKKIEAEVVYGSELIEEGITETFKGIKINPKEKYRRKDTIPVPINHERMLKRAYSEGGFEGVTDYMAEANRVAEKQKKDKAEKEAKEKENPSYDGSQTENK
jgi:hypothetical protein